MTTQTKTNKQPKLLKSKSLIKKGATYLGAVTYKGRGHVEYLYVPGSVMNNQDFEQVAVRVTRDTAEIVGKTFDQRLIDALK